MRCDNIGQGQIIKCCETHLISYLLVNYKVVWNHIKRHNVNIIEKKQFFLYNYKIRV